MNIVSRCVYCKVRRRFNLEVSFEEGWPHGANPATRQGKKQGMPERDHGGTPGLCSPAWE